jgi:hypothetical protein
VRRQATASPAGSIESSFPIFGRIAFAFALAGAAALMLLWVSAGVAQAASSYVYQGESGNGTLGDIPTDIAIEDSTGRVFVADNEKDRVVVFESSQPGAAVLTTFGEGELSAPYGIAIDQGSGDVYVSDAGNDRLVRYTSDGGEPPVYALDATYTSPAKGTGSEEVGSFASPLAMDQSTGDLLLADTANLRVERFDSEGNFLDSFDGTDSSAGAFTSLFDLATAPDGTIYVVANGVEGENGSVEGAVVGEFAGDGSFVEELASGQLGNVRSVGYDPRLAKVLVVSGGGCGGGTPSVFLRVVSAGQVEAEHEIPTTEECSRPVAVAVSSAQVPFSILTAQTPGYGGAGGVLSVKSVTVDVTISAPSAVTSSGAHLSGTVDPHGDAGTARFEYRRVGGSDWISNPDQSVSGEGPQTVEDDLTGLLGNADYEVRLAANVSGLGETSAPMTFHTLLVAPIVATGEARSITDTTAELTGTIDAVGDQTTFRFEYGPTTAYGSQAPAGVEGVAGAGRAPRAFSRPISALQPLTTYHYRLVAKNPAGETAGVDRIFTTLAAGQPAPRTFELVTPVNKKGAVIAQLLGFQAAPDGSALAMQLVAPPTDAEASVLETRYVTRRGPDGWMPWTPTDPPQNVGRAISASATQAVSPDFRYALVVSNRALTPGAYEGGGNLYVRDLETGAFSFVGGNPGMSSYFALSSLQRQWIYMGGADDFDWIMLASDIPLFPGAPQTGIYRWSRTDGLELESRLPDETPAQGVQVAFAPMRQLQVSGDGKTFYFAAGDSVPGVYRRSEGQTTPISVSEIPGDPDTPQRGVIDGVSRDGRYAFFRSQTPLTEGLPPEVNVDLYPGLYRYDAEQDDIEFVGAVVATFDGRVWGASDDGGTIYYDKPPSPGTIDDSATNVWRDGVTSKVTAEHPDQGTESGVQLFVSPNGRFFGYPSRADESIYLFDAETAQNVCVNCDANGAAIGQSRLPGGARTLSNYEPRVVTNEGVMYFDSAAPLLAADHNEAYDVYRYQDGNLTLISPGDGPFDAQFSDATPDGSHVFFTTTEGIVRWDIDQTVDVYDSRTDGTPVEPPPSSAECAGDACQGAAGGSPKAPNLNSDGQNGVRGGGKVRDIRKLSGRQLATLARGGKARLRLSVDAPGRVSLIGRARIDGSKRRVTSASARAKKAGPISVPFSLSKAALRQLRERETLAVTLLVRLNDSSPNKGSFTLRAPHGEKGARS